MYNYNGRPSNNYHSNGGYANRNGGGNSRGGYNSGRGGYGDAKPPLPVRPYKPLANETYVDEAEAVIKALKDHDGKLKLTTSKIRNLLAMSSEILNKVNNELGKTGSSSPVSAEIGKELGYLRVRTVYECGREQSVSDFAEVSNLLKYLKDVKTLGDAELFCHYMEALVAFHRYHGGRDQ